MKEKKLPIQRNSVAKYAHLSNKCVAFVDRKKREGKGYEKHKKSYL